MSRRSWVLLGALGLIWGVPYLFIKIAVGEVTPPVVVFARTAVGALLLLPFALRSRGGLAPLRRHWRAVIAFTLLEVIGPWFWLSNAERTLTSSTTGLLIATVPMGAVVVGRIVDRRPVARVRWLGLLVALGGVGLLLGPGAAAGDAWAVVQVLLAALGYAIAPIVADRRLGDVPPLTLTTAVLALAALTYAPVVALTGPHAWPAADGLAALAILGVVCTGLAFTLFFRLIAEVGGARATLVAYINPLVAVTAGALVLDEPVTWALLGATVLILAGSAAAAKHGRGAAGTVTAPVDLVEGAVTGP
jgi:drug/metabolite transporter (DMT)-like permease